MKHATKRKVFVSTASVTCILCCIWLSFGIYSDREFGGLHLFLKHQLSARFFFYSPHGESDNPAKNDAERSAERDYAEFVDFNDGRKRSLTILQ